jgi:hypothetical protein
MDTSTKDILTLATPTGKAVTVTFLHSYQGESRLWVELPAAGIKGQSSRPLPLKTPTQGATHYLDVAGKAVGLDAANAQRIEDLYQARKAAWGESAAGQAAALRSAREHLVREKAGWLDAMSAAREQAFASDTGAGWAEAKDYEAKATAADEKIAAFDRAHPDVVAAIKAEKDESRRRFLAQD